MNDLIGGSACDSGRLGEIEPMGPSTIIASMRVTAQLVAKVYKDTNRGRTSSFPAQIEKTAMDNDRRNHLLTVSARAAYANLTITMVALGTCILRIRGRKAK